MGKKNGGKASGRWELWELKNEELWWGCGVERVHEGVGRKEVEGNAELGGEIGGNGGVSRRPGDKVAKRGKNETGDFWGFRRTEEKREGRGKETKEGIQSYTSTRQNLLTRPRFHPQYLANKPKTNIIGTSNTP